jgi:hypothetical protein
MVLQQEINLLQNSEKLWSDVVDSKVVVSV